MKVLGARLFATPHYTALKNKTLSQFFFDGGMNHALTNQHRANSGARTLTPRLSLPAGAANLLFPYKLC